MTSMGVTRLAAAIIASILLPWLVQWLDKRRMPPRQKARCWSVATWGAALYAFGPLSMLGWVWVTRDRWRRCLEGALFAAAVWAALGVIDHVVAIISEGGSDGPLSDLIVVPLGVGLGALIFLLLLEVYMTITSAGFRRVLLLTLALAPFVGFALIFALAVAQ